MRSAARVVAVVLAMSASDAPANGASCPATAGVVASGIAAASYDLRLSEPDLPRRVVQFSTPLRVTTDGAPNSFKLDQSSPVPALNILCNAFQVYVVDTGGRRQSAIPMKQCTRKLELFRAFHASGWRQPPGFEVSWRAGLMGRERDGELVPCIFTRGRYAGFLATKTNLTNGLVEGRGECDVADQVDPLSVPGLTIQGGSNFIRSSGVRLGDLAVVTLARADGSTVDVAAVVVDSGGTPYPAMGTVALNAALLDRPVVVETHGQVLTYDIPASALVTIISGTAGTGLKRPYTAANIASRLDGLLAGKGLRGVAGLLAAARTCRAGLGAEAAPKPAR